MMDLKIRGGIVKLVLIGLLCAGFPAMAAAQSTLDWPIGELKNYELDDGYCSANSNSSAYEYIERVQMGTIDNNSGASGYSDFTGQSTDMIMGSGYLVTITLNTTFATDIGAMWVDWNQDEDFFDAGETITTSWLGLGPYTVIVTPPAGATLGATRIRVRIQDGEFEPTLDPCGASSYGEVEDYTIVVDNVPPTGTVCASLACVPDSGVLPFTTTMYVTLENLYDGFIRTVSGKINITLAGGLYIGGWRKGYTNIAAGGTYSTSWNTNLPDYGTLVGTNVFTLVAQDTTASPYNQPPYPPADDTYTSICNIVVNSDTYFIAPDGDDFNPGTFTEPWATITKANSVLQAGDTVYIREGTYPDRIEPANSGTPGNYITYMAYPGETPVIDRSLLITNWTNYSGSIYWADYTGYTIPLWEDTFVEASFHCGLWPVFSLADLDEPGKFFHDEYSDRFYVWTSNGDDPNNHTMRASTGKGAHFNKEYIVIDGIHMKWIVTGILSENCSNCIFKNMDIQYTYGGINLKWETHHNQILNNTIFHAGSWYWDEGDGIYLTGHHTLIEGNDISLTGHNPINTRGFDTGIAAHHNIIQNNRFHDCGSSAICSNYNTWREVWRNNFAYRCTGCGLQVDGFDNAFYNNVCYQNGQAGGVYLTDDRDGGNNKFFNNTFYNNNSLYLHQPDQVLYPMEWEITECTGCIVDGNIFKNNILFNPEDDGTKLYMIYSDLDELRGNVFRYNDFFNGREVIIRDLLIGTDPLSWWEANYPVNYNNNIVIDPLFIDPNNEDYNLNSNSQLINAGTFLTTTVSSGSGSTITVEDAGYFCDGYGIVEGDMIQLEGQVETVRIVDVDYDMNHITIDGTLVWVAGQGIGFPYSSSAPDMGAFEHDGE